MSELLKNDGLKASAEIAKQIIALCTGAVAFTVTFLDKFTQHPKDAPPHIPCGLYMAWALFGLTILFCLLTLMAITGTLDALDRQANGWPLSEAQDAAAKGASGNIRKPALMMLGAFLFAVFAMIFTGIQLALGIG